MQKDIRQSKFCIIFFLIDLFCRKGVSRKSKGYGIFQENLTMWALAYFTQASDCL